MPQTPPSSQWRTSTASQIGHKPLISRLRSDISYYSCPLKNERCAYLESDVTKSLWPASMRAIQVRELTIEASDRPCPGLTECIGIWPLVSV